MSAVLRRAVLVALALAAWPVAHAQQATPRPAYRCGPRAHPTYSDVPCPGARQVGTPQPRRTDKWKQPPQDRAVIAKRARLSPEERQECAGLDRTLAQEQAMLRTRGDAVTIQDEMPLVRAQKRFRELRC